MNKDFKYWRNLFRWILVFLVICFGPQPQTLADQVLLLDDLNPQTTNLGIFNSFLHHTIIVAITQKNSPPFNCHSNRYIFYEYGQENYFEITGGNLKINGNYSMLIASKVHTSIAQAKDSNLVQQSDIETLLSKMNISLQTFEQGKSTSTDGTVSCWQQPEIIELSTRTRRPMPFLMANLCEHAWCSEMHWTDNDHVNLWVQINAKEYHMIRLNAKTGAYEYINKSPKFTKAAFMQLNAPRDNLVTKENINNGAFTLNSKAGEHISVLWKLRPNKNIRIELIRAKKNGMAGRKVRNLVEQLISQKLYSEALQLLEFGFWLSPDDMDLKFERLRVYASLMLVDNFFRSLMDEFTKQERFDVCKKLHLDPALKKLWKQNHFSDKFKQSCL